MSPAHPIGHVKDYFIRLEFQQRGSPHIHCLFWIDDAPKLDENSDNEISRFVDKYISCELPDKSKQPKLYEIVTTVQMHSKAHTKTCFKNSSSCRFHFPKPPVLKTFIAHAEMEAPEQNKTDQQLEENTSSKTEEHTASQKIKDVWKIINSIENIEQCKMNDIMQAANLTYGEFKESLEMASSKTSIYYKRNLTDLWVNNYNESLLRAWNANLDIQFVIDTYACVAYIISYISKSEAEIGALLMDAKKEAKEGNKDAAEAMKHIGQAYIQNREVSAQEAVYRVCGMHLKESSRKTVFVPTGKNPLKMSLPMNVLNSKRSNTDNVWMTSITEKYFARPDLEEFNSMCLARFCSQYTLYPNSRPPKRSKMPGSLHVFELQHNLGYIKEKKKGKENIIRYPRFNRVKDPDQYYMTLIQLYVPHRSPVEKPLQYLNFEEYIRRGNINDMPIQVIINQNRSGFEHDAEEVDRAWNDIQEGRIGEDGGQV